MNFDVPVIKTSYSCSLVSVHINHFPARAAPELVINSRCGRNIVCHNMEPVKRWVHEFLLTTDVEL